MNTDFFADTRPAFIAVNAEGFTVKGSTYSQLQGFIRQIIPVKKLFDRNKVTCYSNDAVKGKNGQHCALCPQTNKCRKRIRLMILLQDEKNGQVPAQFEINSRSFQSLQRMLEPIDEKDMPETLVNIQLGKHERYIQVKFSALF